MGGIKNNLTKKLSKFLPLDGEGGRRSLPDGVINNKVPLWLKGNVRRQSDKGIVLTKYLGIACLSLAILSTLILNIVSSYSSSKVNSNAEPLAEVSTLANEACDPSNTNAPSCISMSISSHSATGDTNDPNLSLSIPQGGGLVAGRHTVSVNVGSEIAKYSVYLNGGDNQNNTDLVNHLADSLPNTGSLTTSIPSLRWSGDFSMPQSMLLYGDAWGVALPDAYPDLYNNKAAYESLITNPANSLDGPMYTFSGVPPLSYGQPGDGGNRIAANKTAATSVDVYYGVKVDNPSTMLAGDYTTNVVYTVVAELKTPSISSVSPNPIRTGSSNKITLTGSNLDIVSKVTIDDRGAIRDCTSLTHSGSTKLTCTLPAISNAGNYIITAETAGGQTAATTIQVKLPAPTITSVSPNEININNSTTALTIKGTNLATTSSVYIDFNNNNKADSGETCTIRTKANGQVTCTAPSRSSAGGPYTVRLTTDGGSTSRANAVSYVTAAPTVEMVDPSTVCTSNDVPRFEIYGSNLGAVYEVELVGGRITGECEILHQSNMDIECQANDSWWFQVMFSVPDGSYIQARLLGPSGATLATINRFALFTYDYNECM